MANPLTKNVTHLKNLLDHFECLPEYLQMNIKYNLNECIEAIYRDYNRKVYYNKYVGLNLSRVDRCELVENNENIDIRESYSHCMSRLHDFEIRNTIKDEILLPAVRKILTIRCYDKEHLSKLFLYGDMTIESISGRILNNNIKYYYDLCEFLFFDVLPYKSRGVAAYIEYSHDTNLVEYGDDEFKGKFHSIIISIIKYIITDKINVPVEDRIEHLAVLIYLLYNELNIKSDPELVFVILSKKYSVPVSNAIRKRVHELKDTKADVLDYIDMLDKIKEYDFELFRNYIVDKNGHNERLEEYNNTREINGVVCYGTIDIDEDLMYKMLEVAKIYTKKYIVSRYFNRNKNISFNIPEENLMFIRREMKSNISILKTDEGMTRYFIEYENEIFMLFTIEGFIDTIGISINMHNKEEDETKIIIMQKDRNLRFKLISDLNELECDVINNKKLG